ncbi:MAG: GIY-YIG nuclease family protein [Rhizobiaceae bacterium]|nr:GIY-YIG nuclease family protein [Rhizobiaceae bacterium]
MTGYVYMTASQKGGTIYIGVTNDLARRIPKHKSGTSSRFTARYGVKQLVRYEEHFDSHPAGSPPRRSVPAFSADDRARGSIAIRARRHS